MITIEIHVFCDNCDYMFKTTGRSIKELREEATTAGWLCELGNDLCPECRETYEK